MRSWFRGSGSSKPSSRPSTAHSLTNGTTKAVNPQQQVIDDLHHAMDCAGMILNDDVEGAEKRLREYQGQSSFHQLGLGIAIFMRSILGFEKDVMAEASARLAECENQAWADMKRAQKDGGAGWWRSASHQAGSDRLFPPGVEYQLVYAEAQIMSAIVSVMHETITDGVKGFYKLRKAYQILEEISRVEKDILAKHKQNGVKPPPNASKPDHIPPNGAVKDAESDMVFVDAPEGNNDSETPTIYQGHLERTANGTADQTPPESKPHSSAASISSAEMKAQPLKQPSASTPDDEENAVSLFTNPIDIFIHSGMNHSFGTLSLLISMVPPAFTRILYIIGFKGDKEGGLRRLWQSTKFDNVHGGVAGLLLLSYYNAIFQNADIQPTADDLAKLRDPSDPNDGMVGIPHERCRGLLARMRVNYAESRLWKLEKARGLANNRKLPEAIAVLKNNTDSKMRQVVALNNFELSLCHFYSMQWNETEESFLRCIELNGWSHALYYYFAGCANLEEYRDALARTRDESLDEETRTNAGTVAQASKLAAETHFRKVPKSAGKKRFMAKQMPLEVFVNRKLAKWEARAAQYQVDLADAIVVSPAAEMIWIWSGFKRMSQEGLERMLLLVDKNRATAPDKVVEAVTNEADEVGVVNLVRGTMLAQLGRYEAARHALQPVLGVDKAWFKEHDRDDYVQASSTYQLGAIAYMEACDPSTWPQEGGDATLDQYRNEKINEAFKNLESAHTWETFTLDGRLGMRLGPGMDALRWLRRKKGLA